MGAVDMVHAPFPGIAASALNDNVAVGAASGGDFHVYPIASRNLPPLGVSIASAAQGDAVSVAHRRGDVKRVIAGASLGRGAEIGVASTNGALGPVAAASGSVVWQVGESTSAAAAGEAFGLYINPRQLSGLA